MNLSALRYFYNSIRRPNLITRAYCNSVQLLEDGLEKQEENSLSPSYTDLSEITPYFPESFNLAAYVNSSHTLQSLLHLNVNLSKIERKPHIVNKVLKLDFDNDIKNHIIYIKDFVEMEKIGEFITKNPLILCEPLTDIGVRVNYLQSKHFSIDQIKQIITRNPFWLMFSTLRIDKRLGYFQQKFSLSGNEIRYLASKQPKLITYNLHHVNTSIFAIKEEMGFSDNEIKHLILDKPKILMIGKETLIERFSYIHNIMKIQHSTILHYSGILMCRNFRIKQRHQFLKSLGRAQYDPKKENYVPISSLYKDTDVEFCRNHGKCNIDDFNMFLKTL